MTMLKIGSLFSGYGGLDMAVEQVLDARTAWVSDIDPGACKILAHRFPDVPNLGDITRIDWAAVEPVDIITGGSPCQDLSHAGRRAGMTEGTRSNLWVSMREAVAHLRPQFVVWENVRGAMSAPADSLEDDDARIRSMELEEGCLGSAGRPNLRAIGRVLGDLAGLGYDARWHGLRVAELGGCHGRWRVFVVAYPRGQRHEWGRLARVGWVGPADSSVPALTLRPTPTTTQRGPDANLATREPARANLHNEVLALLPTPTTEPATGNGHARNLGAEVKPDRWGQYAAAIASHELLTGRPAPEPTELGPKGKPRLSARFCEWMMCLPDGWVTDVPGITRNEALKALGNGVVPPQAVAALRLMVGRLGRAAA